MPKKIPILGLLALALTACSGGSDAPAPSQPVAPPVLSVNSSAFGDTDNTYEAGRVVRIDVAQPADMDQVQSGTITISSASQGYTSGPQPLKFGSIFYEWDTTGLAPASDYKAFITVADATGKTRQDDSLVIALAPNPPAIKKLVSDVDLSVPARGLPTVVARSYLLSPDAGQSPPVPGPVFG